ncbi:MAG: glycosyltransferase family 2 protein [Bacteroidetes bacterium]|nr:glycosyltransferase family 2 protein [Bacteroidota bacterium]
MTELSVVIITFNEERNIGRCLDSVKEIADDIVVIDSFSTDKTEEICLANGARFIKHEFPGHIEQKNWAISQAKFPFILSLDADEALSEELKKSIIEAKKNTEFDGYIMNRLTNYCGKWIHHSGWYPDAKLRLWDSAKGKWGGVNPHDKYEMESDVKIKHLKGDIYHYSYYSINEHILQANKFSEIMAKALFKNGKNASFLKVIFRPPMRFFRDYFLKMGFLDGFYGFVICKTTAYTTFLKYSKLRQLNLLKK